MKKFCESFFRVLFVLMLCQGLTLISCDKEQPNNGEDTVQVGGENNGGPSGDNTGSGSEGGNDSGGGTGEEPGGNTGEELPDAITNSFAGVTLTLSLRNLTEVGVVFYIKAVLADSYSADEFGIFYSTNEQISASSATNLPIVDIYGTDYSLSTSSLKPNTTYYYTSYIKQGSLYKYGEVKSFTTKSLVAPTLSEASEITEGSATISGAVVLPAGTSSDLEFGFQYGKSESFSLAVTTKKISEVDSENKFSYSISSLVLGTNYYYRSYIKMNGSYKYGDVKSFTTVDKYLTVEKDLNMLSAMDLSSSSSANCYVVSSRGTYKFKVVQGNSSASVGVVKSCAMLWETFGTGLQPLRCELINAICYKDGYIAFQTADTFKEGNAVIAAKDASGEILWSWHIWMTDAPQGQVYYNYAGTMMDRNLGATSATPGDVGALGLLYQWGRKDPFLGGSSISSYWFAESTITWPSAVSSTSSTGTIAYATKNPTTFISASSSRDHDWHYSSRDNTLWTTSDKAKSIYDPCPPGWRVPDGGSNGVWSKAVGSSSSFSYNYSNNIGMNFSGKFGSASTIWYPALGHRTLNGSLDYVSNGYYWSASPFSDSAYNLCVSCGCNVYPSDYTSRVFGFSVRCIQEGPWGPSEILNAVDLSSSGSANSYIISEAGAYKFKAVQGNSETSVGTVASATVLWESFGTDVTPTMGDLVRYVLYKDGYISFQTADVFKEGNAVIAAKDASGNILWSWHIWLTDKPQGQVYYNNAGTMMDRNLGATSATPGDVGALGLLYQWGRKDPFLGGSSISSSTDAKSTITWPSAVSSTSSTGTIAYATKNPTRFITLNSNNYDWYYTGSEDTDNTRWTTSDKTKSIYDPCPPGWRVSDGGSNGVWSKAVGSSSSFSYAYNSSNKGMNFSGKFGSASTIWYPASDCRSEYDGRLCVVGNYGCYWSASPGSNYAYFLDFGYNGVVTPSYNYHRAYGQSVRCIREGTGGASVEVVAKDLSSSESANSYIISEAGAYKFKAVQGNSETSVGAVATAEVLWETFGTDVTPTVGDLVKKISYADGYVTFEAAANFKEGNAVIAAKDASGNILWSWHIWMTDAPQGQVYYNNAGTMMDRNLGATSATPGDVGALGLLYQWGRKDPFLGSSSISSNTLAKSTTTWPSAVSSTSSTGTIAYATKNPTTFISGSSSTSYDWHYSSRDNTLWTTSDKTKSIYDPCPPGWRVPDGVDYGVWSKAVGSWPYFTYTYNNTNNGMNFSGKFGSASTIWYPASGYRSYYDGSLDGVGFYGNYLSASPSYDFAYDIFLLYFNGSGNVYPMQSNRTEGYSVRCLQE